MEGQGVTVSSTSEGHVTKPVPAADTATAADTAPEAEQEAAAARAPEAVAAGGTEASDGTHEADGADQTAGGADETASGADETEVVGARPHLRVDGRLLEAALLNLRRRTAAIPLVFAAPGAEAARTERAKLLSQ